MTIITEQSEPEREPAEWQLYYYDTIPCQWLMSVRGGPKLAITVHDLAGPVPLTCWLMGRRYSITNVPENRVLFKQKIEMLIATAIKMEKEPLPFMQTDAGIMEKLALYFGEKIKPVYRSKGQEFLDGKWGQEVRVKEGKIYFNWDRVTVCWKHWYQAKDKDIDALKLFISDKGGHTGDTGRGVRGWLRWKYWLPLDLFPEQVQESWFNPDSKENEE
jgi:hypothetical protein